MANANTNLMSVNINQPASSTGSNSRNSGLSKYSSSSKSGSDFNSALDRANNQINQQNQPAQSKPSDSEDIQYTEAAAQNPAQPVESKNTKTQGQNQQPQDAPQNIPTTPTAEKNIPAEIKIAPTENIAPQIEIQPAENILPEIEVNPVENFDTSAIPIAPEIPAALPYIFTANTETLLPAQNTEKVGEVNLMTIMPKNDAEKSQAMLNILSGKTWTAEDVKATLSSSPQTPQNIEINPATLPVHETGKNLNLNPNQTKIPENIQPQILNQPVQIQQQPPILPQQQIVNPEQPVQIQPQFQTQIQPQQQNLNPEQPVQIQPQFQTQIQPQQNNLNLEQPVQNQNQAQPANLNLAQPSQVQPQIQQQPIQQQPPQMQTQPQFEIQNQPVLNSVQPQIEPKQVNLPQQLSDLFGQNLQVEENQNVAPLPPVQQTFRQQPEQNQQQLNQNLQQNFSQDLNSEMQAQQNSGGTEETFAPNLAPVTNNVTTAQPVTQVQNPEAAAQAARENNIPAQIVEQARMIRTAENTEMVINLKPEHLGQLTLRVSVSQNGAVNASFYSDNAQVRAAIENSLVQLKQELNEQGLKVENVQVYAGLADGGLMNGQGQQAWQQNQQQNSAPRRIDFDALQEEVDAVNSADENNSADGVDYKI